jgi:hypothetical protein
LIKSRPVPESSPNCLVCQQTADEGEARILTSFTIR